MINTINQFFTKIYIWMAFGVLISAISAWATWNTGLIVILQNPILFYGIVAIEIGIALGMQWLINKLSTSFASTLYVIYAILNGITLSGILAYYLTQNANVVLVIFLVAASMFGFLAFLGFTTKKDLSGWRTFLMVGMWGVFFSSIVNIFLQNSLFDTVLSAIALLVFAGLTVYDNQYYKNLFSHLNTEDQKNKSVIIGALHMYINFVMIFQNLLKLFGNNR